MTNTTKGPNANGRPPATNPVGTTRASATGHCGADPRDRQGAKPERSTSADAAWHHWWSGPSPSRTSRRDVPLDTARCRVLCRAVRPRRKVRDRDGLAVADLPAASPPKVNVAGSPAGSVRSLTTIAPVGAATAVSADAVLFDRLGSASGTPMRMASQSTVAVFVTLTAFGSTTLDFDRDRCVLVASHVAEPALDVVERRWRRRHAGSLARNGSCDELFGARQAVGHNDRGRGLRPSVVDVQRVDERLPEHNRVGHVGLRDRDVGLALRELRRLSVRDVGRRRGDSLGRAERERVGPRVARPPASVGRDVDRLEELVAFPVEVRLVAGAVRGRTAADSGCSACCRGCRSRSSFRRRP